MKIIKLEVKKQGEWCVATIEQDDKSVLADVSINKKSKKGDEFPNFDTLAEGQEIKGKLWQNDKGKWYLFPLPKSEENKAMIEDTWKLLQSINRKVDAIGKKLFAEELANKADYPKGSDKEIPF